MCFLLKHNLGDCTVHLGGLISFWQELEAEAVAGEEAEDVCHPD